MLLVPALLETLSVIEDPTLNYLQVRTTTPWDPTLSRRTTPDPMPPHPQLFHLTVLYDPPAMLGICDLLTLGHLPRGIR